MVNATDRLTDTDTVIVVGEREGGTAFCRGGKFVPVLPGKGVPVIVYEGIAVGVVGDTRTAELGQLVPPYAVPVGVPTPATRICTPSSAAARRFMTLWCHPTI